MSIKDKIGTAAVIGQLVEELAELMAALAKEERRLRGESPTPCTEQECMEAVREEISDVLNCIGELQDAGYWYDPRIMAEKMKRWESRVAEKHSPVATNIIKSLFNWDTIRAYTGGDDVMEHTAHMMDAMAAANDVVRMASGAMCVPDSADKVENSTSEEEKANGLG